MPLDFSQESLATSCDRRFDFLENELFRKDEKIEALRISHEMGQKELSQLKMELSVAKSYINSLPTLEEVGRLKDALSDLIDKKEQLTRDLRTLKEVNSELNSKISALHRNIVENESALRSKETEVDALQYTMKLWENRRRAAQQAGHVTVEDIVADKMKLEEQFQDMMKIAACREEFFKARIDKMKSEIGKQKHMLDAQKEICASLRVVAERLTAESEEVSLENKMLKGVKTNLEKDLVAITVEIRQLKPIEVIQKKTDNDIRFCIREISKCQKATRRIIVFIEDAISKKFLDPSLLFSTCDDSAGNESEDDENLKKCARNQLSEIDSLRKHIENCQKMITDIYVSKLSTLEDSQCQIQ